jgi:hypothetical protein
VGRDARSLEPMTATFIQPLGNVTAGQRIVLSRPDWALTGIYDAESVEHLDNGNVHLRAKRVDAGNPPQVDGVYPGDLSVGIVPKEKTALG